MRILDKKTDFYDFYKDIYSDNTTTFDRRNSFLLTKPMLGACLYNDYEHKYDPKGNLNAYNFLLLQICNTFWLLFTETTQVDENDMPVDYSVELLTTWKNYNKPRVLIRMEVIHRFGWKTEALLRKRDDKRFFMYSKYEKSSVLKRIPLLRQAIDLGDYWDNCIVGKRKLRREETEEDCVPLLKASGISGCIDPLDVYLSFDEYFSLNKTASETTHSKDITDSEKIVNHGFDTKISFRGKRSE